MSKCTYCMKEIETMYPVTIDNNQFTCCCDDCVNKTKGFYDFSVRHKLHFIIGLVIAMVIFFSGSIILIFNKAFGTILFSLGLALFGVDTLIFPFATPQTYSLCGIKKTIVITRIVGACVIVLSIWLGYIL